MHWALLQIIKRHAATAPIIRACTPKLPDPPACTRFHHPPMARTLLYALVLGVSLLGTPGAAQPLTSIPLEPTRALVRARYSREDWNWKF